VALPSSTVGHAIEPLVHEVDARWLMAYAAGVGDDSPRYFDTGDPAGIVAHPLFPVCLEWPAVLELRRQLSTVLPPAERLRGVHATHDLTLHRPIVPGDVLTTTARVVSVEPRSPGAYEVVRLDSVDATGAPVATTYMGSIFVGVEVDGAPAAIDEPPPAPTDADPTSDERCVDVALGATAAHTYTECARIWNPIHTDVAVARAAGLPSIILHGTASLARAVSWAVEPGTAVARVAGRFGAPVPLPSTVALAASSDARDPRLHHIGVADAEGRPVLRDAFVVTAEPPPDATPPEVA
jgi:acyl dehydratase